MAYIARSAIEPRVQTEVSERLSDNRHLLMLAIGVMFAGCSKPGGATAKQNWFQLAPGETAVQELTLQPEQVVSITVPITERCRVGFKTDVSTLYAAEHRTEDVTIADPANGDYASSPMKTAREFKGSAGTVRLELSSSFSVPVRVVVYTQVLKDASPR
jgi:hypothetical protein